LTNVAAPTSTDSEEMTWGGPWAVPGAANYNLEALVQSPARRSTHLP